MESHQQATTQVNNWPAAMSFCGMRFYLYLPDHVLPISGPPSLFVCIGDFFLLVGGFLASCHGLWLVLLVVGGLGLVRIGGVGAAAFFFGRCIAFCILPACKRAWG